MNHLTANEDKILDRKQIESESAVEIYRCSDCGLFFRSEDDCEMKRNEGEYAYDSICPICKIYNLADYEMET
jgi:rubredoxin